jgi:hypothetical protein
MGSLWFLGFLFLGFFFTASSSSFWVAGGYQIVVADIFLACSSILVSCSSFWVSLLVFFCLFPVSLSRSRLPTLEPQDVPYYYCLDIAVA